VKLSLDTLTAAFGVPDPSASFPGNSPRGATKFTTVESTVKFAVNSEETFALVFFARSPASSSGTASPALETKSFTVLETKSVIPGPVALAKAAFAFFQFFASFSGYFSEMGKQPFPPAHTNDEIFEPTLLLMTFLDMFHARFNCPFSFAETPVAGIPLQ
jgi:hypothetical protein